MTKNFLTKLLIGGLIMGGLGGMIFFASHKKEPKEESNFSNQLPTPSVEKKIAFEQINVCDLIPKELIEETIEREIVKVEWVELKTIRYCAYYTHYIDPQVGGANVIIGFSNENYEEIKKELTRPGIENEFVKDTRIPVEHYLIKSRVGKIWEIDLFLGNNWYLGIKSNREAVSGEELIKIALKILEKKPEIFSSKKNESREEVPLPQGEDIIRNFASFIEDGKPEKAVLMMKLKDDTEKQMWAVQFAAINSFKILKIEKFDEDHWTKDKQIYKILVDVWMDPRSADAPIPYYGWENGENVRWITLEKVDNIWKISEINTSP